MHARVVLGVGKGVLFREVSSVQECPHCILDKSAECINSRSFTLHNTEILYCKTIDL